VVGDSRSLSRWPEPCQALSSSADGQRLVFRTALTRHNVYEGDFGDSEKTLLRVRRLTFGQGRDDFPRAWTRDSKTILFDSNRNGKWEIFQQERKQVSDEPFVQLTVAT
jgi:Tol biopolymer transport system component